MAGPPNRILFLEDSPDDRAIVQSLLGVAAPPLEVVSVTTPGEYQAALEQGSLDLVLAAYPVAAFEGLEEQVLTDFLPDLRNIHSASKQLLLLISDLLDLTAIESGTLGLKLEYFDVGALIQEAIADIQPLMLTNANQLHLHGAEELGAMQADRTKVRQSLYSLLANAAKFTQQGVVTLAVKRERSDRQDWLIFTVKDTGIGMTDEQLQRLFQEFSLGDDSTTRRYGGAGLSLALSYQLCRLMGGNISVESEWGRGSTFMMCLPAIAVACTQPAATAPQD